MSTSQPSIEDFLHSFRSSKCVHRLHSLICQSGLEAYPSLGSQLISSLTETQSIGLAQQVFHKLIYQDVYSWNSLITGFVKCRAFHLARIAFDHMQGNNVFVQPSVHAYVALLKTCAITQDIDWGCKLYAEMAQNGLLERETFAGSALVNMFAKCGLLEKAQAIFDKLVRKDVVAWNALIAGYVDQEKGEKALDCLPKMQQLGVPLSSVTLICCLAACCSTGSVIKGQEIHAEALKRGLEEEGAFGNSLVDMYAKCGELVTAQNVFDNLVVRDVISWNILITGHVDFGRYEDAIHLLELMHVNAFSPDDVTFLCSIKASASIGIIEKGWNLHDGVIKFGLEKEALIANTLVDMYAKCGALATAERLMRALSTSDVILWNAIVAAYADYGCADDSLNCIPKMYQAGASPNVVTFISLLKGCSIIEASYKGHEVHAAALKYGFENELLFGSALVDMYCKCGMLVEALNVFNNLQVRNVVSWNTLIAGYTYLGHDEESFHCFVKMKNESVSPCATTFVCLLKACSHMGASSRHQELHAEIAKMGLDGELLINNVLVDLYMKYGWLTESQHTFYKLPNQDLVSWASLISGLADWGCYEEVLDCLEEMQHQGISPNSVIYVCSAKACGDVGAAIKGQELHTAILKQGLERDSVVGNILVHMYANSGCFLEAQVVFEALSTREVVSWNALISGYAQLGDSEKVVNMFDRMSEEGAKPNHVTLLSFLHACSHAGVIDRGLHCFEAIIHEYCLLPTLKQYTCLVDVLGRAGFLENTVTLTDNIPFQPDMALWLIVLGACRKWADVDIGKCAFEQAMQLGESDSTPYVCMSNIYRDADMFDEALRIDKMALKYSRDSWSKCCSLITEISA